MIEKLKKALEGVEIDFSLDDLHIMPKDDFNTLVEGYKNTIEETKTKSSKIGQEILLKELKNDIGLDYDKRKDPEALKKAYIDKFGQPKPNDEGIEELQKKFTKELADRDSKYENLVDSHKKESDSKTIKDALSKDFSNFADKTNYKTDDLVTIALSKSEFTVIDGNVFQSKDGEPLKNDSFQGITSTSFADSMMKDGYIKKAEGGRVIGDETKGGKYTMEQFISSAESSGENINGLEFAEKLDDAVKSGVIEG
jgi:hypothetical protein